MLETHMIETHIKLRVWQSRIFQKKMFCHKNWENGPKMGQKQGFLDILKNFVVNFYWICSIMKIYIIYCVPAQIPYLGKFWFLRYGPKWSQPIRLQDFLINHISRTDQWNSLFFCMLIQIQKKLKVYQFFFGWAWSKNGSGQSGHGSLILAVSQERIDVMNWFFTCCCKFRKAKSYFNDFWVGLVRNEFSHLVHETLKSAEWIYGLSWFFACWLWCNHFLLDWHWTFYFWLLNADLLRLYIFLNPLVVPGRILWNRVCSSFPPDICLSVFLEFDHEISLDFSSVIETLMKLCMTTRFVWKIFFVPNIGEMGQK